MSIDNQVHDASGVTADLILENKVDLWMNITVTPGIANQTIYTTDPVAATLINAGLMPPGGTIVLKAHFTNTAQQVHIDESQTVGTILLNCFEPILALLGGGASHVPKYIQAVANNFQLIYSTMMGYYDWHDILDFFQQPISIESPGRLLSTAGHLFDFIGSTPGKALISKVLTEAGRTQEEHISDVVTVLSLLKGIADNIAYAWMTLRYGNGSYAFVPIQAGLQPQPPQPPILQSPVSESVISNPPLFQWSSDMGANSYHFQLSLSSTFSTLAYDTNTTQSSLTPPLSLIANTTFFWRVAGVSNSAGQGDFSNPAAFTVGQIVYPPQPQPTSDQAIFIADVTIPDGTVVSPNEAIAKAWRFQNTGTTTWGAGYQLVYKDGNRMGAPSSVGVPTTAPNGQADVSVSLIAPSSPGTYTGHWQLRNPQGTFFGPVIWATIKVLASSSAGHITVFDVTPGSPTNATLVHLVGRATWFPEFRSMRFVAGNQYFERPNFKQIGDQLEISTDWNTASLPRGSYALALEIATTGDPGWVQPERQIIPFTLSGTPAGTGRPPERPILQGPYNWYLVDNGGSASNVQMCVYPSSDPDGNAVQYYFELNGGAQNSGWISSTCWSPSLSAGGYSWRVKASDGTNPSDWSSDTWNFNVATGNISIGTPTVYLPNDPDNTHFCVLVTTGGIIVPEVRAWINSAADGSQNGDWIMLDHYGPNGAPDCTTLNVHGFWLRSDTFLTGNHVIRINARRSDNGYSTTLTFTHSIPYMRPPSPQLVAPATNVVNGTHWNNYTIHYTWTVPLRTASQILRVSTSADLWNDPNPLINLVLGPTVSNTTSTFNQDYGQLYWGVQATNANGSAQSASSVWFGIDHVNPACTMQSLAATTWNNVFQVNWNGTDNSAGIQTYDLQVLDSGRGAWGDWLLSVPVSQTFELFSGQPGHSYGFRCRATDQAGNQNAFPANAQTTIRIDPSTLPPTPWWNNAYALKRNLTILNNMPALDLPAGYPVHLHFDGTTSPTAAEVYNASQSANKCDDLRIVYSDTVELNRLIPTCTSGAVDVWFRTQVGITAATSNSTAHQLYIGNAAASAPPADSSQVWYPFYESDTTNLYFFQEGTGSTAYDSSGNGRNCSIDASVQWSSGRWGNGLYFSRANSGNSRSLSCGTVPALSSFTIDFWYKAGTDGDGRIAGAMAGGGNGGGGNNWLLEAQSKRIVLTVWPCGPCGSSSVQSNFDLGQSPYVDQWNHIAVTFDGASTVKIWINGNLDKTGTLSGSGINTFSPPLEIGSAEGGSQLKGYLGALRISSGVKTSFSYGSLAAVTSEPSVAAGGPLTPPAAGAPDLAMTDLQTLPYGGNGVIVQATIQNQGNLNTLNGFFTDVYLNHVPTGSGYYTGTVQFWVDEPITAGQSITLTTVLTNLISLPGMSTETIRSGPDAAINETSGTLYGQVDSTGAVTELNKNNNIYSAGAPICVASADSYESDNTPGGASVINVDQSQLHNFSSQGDQDWVKFTAQQGITYTLTTSNLGPSADTYLYIYGMDGTTLLASNDDYGGGLASQLVWKAPAYGTYYSVVKNWNPNTSGCGTSYVLSLNNQKLFLPIVVR